MSTSASQPCSTPKNQSTKRKGWIPAAPLRPTKRSKMTPKFLHQIGRDRDIELSTFKDYVTFTTWERNIITGKRERVKNRSMLISLLRWRMLSENLEEIQEAYELLKTSSSEVDLQVHLGGNWYVSIKSGWYCVDLRRWYMPNTDNAELTPGVPGIGFKFSEWDNIIQLLPTVNPVLDLDTQIPCYMASDHQNQEGALRCSECNPNDFMNWLDD